MAVSTFGAMIGCRGFEDCQPGVQDAGSELSWRSGATSGPRYKAATFERNHVGEGAIKKQLSPINLEILSSKW